MTTDLSRFVRSWLEPTTVYVPGRSPDATSDSVRLDWNESPYPLSPRVRETVAEFADANRYPEFRQDSLKAALADYIDMPADRLVVGAGLDDVFNTLAMLLIEPGDNVIIHDPTFSMYRSLFQQHGAEVIDVPLGPAPGFSLDVDGMIDAVDERTKLVIICNPNNPTGNLFATDDVARIVDHVACPVAIDEAYAEFAGVDHLDLARTRDNVIVLRTLSKYAGLAGMRIGYGVVPESLVPYIATVTPAFCNISALSAAMAIAALDDREYLDRNLAATLAERTRVSETLDQFDGVQVYPSSTNFILFRLPVEDSAPVLQGLMEQNVFVRRFGHPAHGLLSCLRVSVGSPEENDAFLAALAITLQHQGTPV